MLADGSTRFISETIENDVFRALTTRDGSEVGFWNQEKRAWEPIEGYENWMSEGLRVAKKQSAPQLIRVPLPRPEKGGSN